MGRSQVGFTLAELMIVLVIIGMAMMLVIASCSPNSEVKMTVNGAVQQTCIDGYRYIISPNGRAVQVMDAYGRATTCEVN